MVVTVKRVLDGAKSDAILGINDRALILDYAQRALELYADRADWDIFVGEINICSDPCGIVTLPSFVDTPIQVNVGGCPTVYRNHWFEFHLNGPGERCGPTCGFTDDRGRSPVFQDLKEWSMVAAICEDAIDGNGTLEMIVEGNTKDRLQQNKAAITLPVSGPSTAGVKIPLLMNWASTDDAFTYFSSISRVTKPVTRGYVKLIGFPLGQMAKAVTLGYYGPNETNPMYRRIRVGATCRHVRVKFRYSTMPLVDDWQVVPIASYQACLDLIKSVRLSDSNNVDASEAYLAKALRLLTQIQNRSAAYTPLQVERGFGVGTIDVR